jgi:hypothetical protein
MEKVRKNTSRTIIDLFLLEGASFKLPLSYWG